MPEISLCYILKNEEAYIKDSILSAESLASEILIHDTGSTDRTLEILKELSQKIPKIRVSEMNWPDDFALARNRIADEAKGPWILFLDGDEILDHQGQKKIQEAVSSDKADCYSLIQRNYVLNPNFDSSIRTTKLPDFLKSYVSLYYFDNWMERLYKKNQGLRYEGRVHESLLPICRRLGLRHQKLPATLHHAGRLKPIQSEKLKYYLKLSTQKLKEEPNNPAAWIELSLTSSEMSLHAQALEVITQARLRFPDEAEIQSLSIQCALSSEEYALAEIWARELLLKEPESEITKSKLSTALLFQAKWNEAKDLALQILEKNPHHFNAHLNLGIFYFENKEFDKAKPHLMKAYEMKPEDSFLREALKKIPT